MLDFLKKRFGEKRIHLDYASTTPVRAEVLRAMLPYFREAWANPSAIYHTGVIARQTVEDARVRAARLLRIRPEGVLFTSGGTEANNQALIGRVEQLHTEGRAYADMEIVTTPIEHPSILETCAYLKARGVTIRYVDVMEDGLINYDSFTAALTPLTVLVTCAYVNSEVGVVQDVKRLTRQVRLFNEKNGTQVLVHLDAAQAPLWLPCEMDMLGVDLMTLDAGKCYGPKGVGILARRHGVSLGALFHGGGQEGDLRSGTENVPLIVGCVAALLRAQSNWKERSAHVALLRDTMFDVLRTEIPDAIVNGSHIARVANNVHISIPGIDSEYAVITLDAHGIAASTKSACGSGSSHGSYVVRAMTNSEERATSTIRFTLGEETTKKDLLRAIYVLKEHVIQVRAFREMLPKPVI